MRTDVITVSSNGKQMSAALEQVEKMASFKGLSSKGTLQLRLLTEEMMGMMRSITGEKEGQFWIEDEDGVYQLHLRMNTIMDPAKREQLLGASTSGKNEAARGLMGRLRDFFEQGDNLGALPYFMSEADDPTAATMRWEWSMNAYQNTLQDYMDQDQRAREAWDELEKSVVTHVADEIKVFIRGGQTEMTIIKKLG
ncbi:MAG: hypothetical protein J6J41_00190 [Clostridia bacterium]|nr:hypothetical protein [Clostridia bacterium]